VGRRYSLSRPVARGKWEKGKNFGEGLGKKVNFLAYGLQNFKKFLPTAF